MSFPSLFIYEIQNTYDTNDSSNQTYRKCSLKFDNKANKFYLDVYYPFSLFITYLIPLIIIVSSYFRLNAYIEYTNQPKRVNIYIFIIISQQKSIK